MRRDDLRVVRFDPGPRGGGPSISISEKFSKGKGRLGGAWQVIVDTFRQVIVDTFWMDAVEKHWEERGAPSVCRGVLETEDEHCRGVPMLRD